MSLFGGPKGASTWPALSRPRPRRLTSTAFAIRGPKAGPCRPLSASIATPARVRFDEEISRAMLPTLNRSHREIDVEFTAIHLSACGEEVDSAAANVVSSISR
jgi:hypothetical protein